MSEKTKGKSGRPRHGKELKQCYTIRIEPSVHKEIVEWYGSLANFFEIALKQQNKKPLN